MLLAGAIFGHVSHSRLHISEGGGGDCACHLVIPSSPLQSFAFPPFHVTSKDEKSLQGFAFILCPKLALIASFLSRRVHSLEIVLDLE